MFDTAMEGFIFVGIKMAPLISLWSGEQYKLTEDK